MSNQGWQQQQGHGFPNQLQPQPDPQRWWGPMPRIPVQFHTLLPEGTQGMQWDLGTQQIWLVRVWQPSGDVTGIRPLSYIEFNYLFGIQERDQPILSDEELHNMQYQLPNAQILQPAQQQQPQQIVQQQPNPFVVWPQMSPDRWHEDMPPMIRPPGPLPENIAFDDLTRRLYFLQRNLAGEWNVQRVFTLEEYNRYMITTGQAVQPVGIPQDQEDDNSAMAHDSEDDDDISIDNGEGSSNAPPPPRRNIRNQPTDNRRRPARVSTYAGITRRVRRPAPGAQFNSSGQGITGMLTEAELDALPSIPNPNRTPTEQVGPDDPGPPYDDGPKKEREQKNLAISRIRAARRYMGIKRKPAIPPSVTPEPRNTYKSRSDRQARNNKKLNDWHYAKMDTTSANHDANYRKKYFNRKNQRSAHNDRARAAGLQHRHNWERANGATDQQLSAPPDVGAEDDDDYYQDMEFFRARGPSSAATFAQDQLDQTRGPVQTRPSIPTSNRCQGCYIAKKACDISQRGSFPCTRCEQLGKSCTNGPGSRLQGVAPILQGAFASTRTIAPRPVGSSSPAAAALARQTNRVQGNSVIPSAGAAPSPRRSVRSNRAVPYDIQRISNSIRQNREPTPEEAEDEDDGEEPCSNCKFDNRACGSIRPCEQCYIDGCEITCDPSSNPDNNRWPFRRQQEDDRDNNNWNSGAGRNPHGLGPPRSVQGYGSSSSYAGPSTSPYGMPPGSNTGAFQYTQQGPTGATPGFGRMNMDGSNMTMADYSLWAGPPGNRSPPGSRAFSTPLPGQPGGFRVYSPGRAPIDPDAMVERDGTPQPDHNPYPLPDHVTLNFNGGREDAGPVTNLETLEYPLRREIVTTGTFDLTDIFANHDDEFGGDPCDEYTTYPRIEESFLCGMRPAPLCEIQNESHFHGHCITCHHYQNQRVQDDQDVVVRSTKARLCEECANQLRRQGTAQKTRCICQATLENAWFCHQHRDTGIEDLKTLATTVQEHIVRTGDPAKCVGCRTNDEGQVFTGAWGCKVCREWVVDWTGDNSV